MTPYSLAFYMDVVTTGTVLGLRPTDPPDRVTEVLGPGFAENDHGGVGMFRDYGLAEFHWHRDGADRPWSGHHFTLQVHRLAARDRTLVNAAIRARHGRFAPRLRFAKLQRLLERRGVPLVEVPESAGNAPYYRTFRQPASRVAVSVIGAHGEYNTPDDLRVGDVYSIQAPMTDEEAEYRIARAARQQDVPPVR
ncbi:hypothetical protein [Streptomyces sp. Isolate_45]|uniref:hypothetical protein n=1 Tax=Streptomyces sp. Isolate_45 TaxID=2950111 RepID=UPI002481C9D9|nr:hypothetical protein [Streptomyces sp. Isolate_45]MDA5279300.1 hypothetical protein [Streptomyces sp. Isolate_45]